MQLIKFLVITLNCRTHANVFVNLFPYLLFTRKQSIDNLKGNEKETNNKQTQKDNAEEN